MEAAAGGDAAALRTLLQRYGPRVGGEIESQIGARWQSLLDAEGVMQVTYLEAFLQAGQLEGRDSGAFTGWLRRIANNTLRDAIRELSRAKRPESGQRLSPPVGEDSYVALVELLGHTTTTPSRHAAQAELGQTVNRTLDRLPPDYQTVIRLYDLEGQPIQQVADTMQRSPGAVHMMRARAHDQLRTLLGAEASFFSNPA